MRNKTISFPTLLLLPLLLLAAGGCVFEPYRETVEFDLAVKPVEMKQPVVVLELRNESSSGVRLRRRLAEGRVVGDPYNRWVLPPGELVARALTLALAGGNGAESVILTGSLECFEQDVEAGTFRLAGRIGLAGGAVSRMKRFDISVPVKDNSAEATAAAASEAVWRLAGELAAGNHRP